MHWLTAVGVVKVCELWVLLILVTVKQWEPGERSIDLKNRMLLLLLSRFSCVWLCATPYTAGHQAPPVPGILQARTLEWVAISFSNAWKWKVKVKSLSHVRVLATPWTAAYQAPPSMGLSRQEHWSGMPLPSPIYTLPCVKQLVWSCRVAKAAQLSVLSWPRGVKWWGRQGYTYTYRRFTLLHSRH